MPAGSGPERRSASRPPSAASIGNGRWMASRALKSTATQNSPALARARNPRSGSRATATRMSTRIEKGATCWVVTWERSSMRRSLHAMRAASRNKDGLLGCGFAGVDRRGGAGHDVDDPVGEGFGTVELVRREHDGGHRGDDPAGQIVEQVAARSEEHTSELQSLMRTSYAVFCLKQTKDE